jgi:hypothetical protein
MTCSPIAGDMATEMAMSAPTTERIRGMLLVSHYSIGPTTSMASLDGEVGAFVAPGFGSRDDPNYSGKLAVICVSG